MKTVVSIYLWAWLSLIAALFGVGIAGSLRPDLIQEGMIVFSFLFASLILAVGCMSLCAEWFNSPTVLPSEKRPWQFSIGSLLVVTTVVAGLCSFGRMLPAKYVVLMAYVLFCAFVTVFGVGLFMLATHRLELFTKALLAKICRRSKPTSPDEKGLSNTPGVR
jgi:hypothetical protein